MINKSALFFYRTVATFLLYGILFWTAWFCVKLLFYASNHSWIVPLIISKQDPSVLDAAEKIITTEQTLTALKLDSAKNQEALSEMASHRDQLAALYPQLVAAIQTEQQADTTIGSQLQSLNGSALAQDVRFEQAAHFATTVGDQIDVNLAAGLITKGEAAIEKAQMAQEASAAVNYEINNTVLKDQILQKTTVGTQALDVLDKKAELRSQISTLELSMVAAKRQLDADRLEIKDLEGALQLVNDTPYAAVLNGEQNFAFVPYSAGDVVPDTPVFACRMDFLLCHEAGTISKVYSEEEREQNPVSLPLISASIRGIIVQIHLSDAITAKSQALFLNQPPLF